MKKISRLSIFLLIALFVFVLVGCKDKTAPTINAPKEIEHALGVDTDLLANVTVTDDVSAVDKINIEITDNGGYNKNVVGTYTITVTATDESGNKSTATIVVKVTDKEKPVIVMNSTTFIHAVGENADLLTGVSATDNSGKEVDLQITNYGDYDKSTIGTYTITITATDVYGNTDTATRTIVVESADKIGPMIITQGAKPVDHIAGDDCNFFVDLEAIDNVDGPNVIWEVSDFGTYDKNVIGEYTIQVICKDSSGNSSLPFSRKVIVKEKYARVEMLSKDNILVRCPVLYNPQVLNGNTATNYNTGYDGEYAICLSKDYFEWLLEYSPERIGSHMGWCVVACTNADDEIVYVRHWSTGEAYMENGEVKSVLGSEWCTGSVRTWQETINGELVSLSNGKYGSSEYGMQLANINKWIPENGHVVIFMNWATTTGYKYELASSFVEGTVYYKEDGTLLDPQPANQDEFKAITSGCFTRTLTYVANSSDMPRAYGANHIMNSDLDEDGIYDYALGKKLSVADGGLSNSEIFDKENPFPVITIPYNKYINNSGVYKNDYTDYVYTKRYNESNPYNPLLGVTANDGKGNDITSSITYRIISYKTQKQIYGLETATSLPMNSYKFKALCPDLYFDYDKNVVELDKALKAKDGTYYVLEYTVEANGHKDVAYRLMKICQQTPDYLELFNDGDTAYSVAMNVEQRLQKNPDLSEFGSFLTATKGILYVGNQYVALQNAKTLNKGVVVVLDKYYNVKHVRVVNGSQFEVNKGVLNTNISWDSSDMFKDIQVENDEYVLVYPEGVMDKALKAFYDTDFNGGEITTPNPSNGLVRFEFLIKNIVEVSSIEVSQGEDKVSFPLNENIKASLITDGSGAGFRRMADGVYTYTKEMYVTYINDAQVKNSWTNTQKNYGTPWYNNAVIVVVDSQGEFVLARVGVGAACEVDKEGNAKYTELTWDVDQKLSAPDGVPHGIFVGLETVIPDGGMFYLFSLNNFGTKVRDAAIKMFYNSKYPGSGAIKDATTIKEEENPDDFATLVFESAKMTKEHLASTAFNKLFVSTEVANAAKISRPIVKVENGIATFEADENALQYDLYIDGKLKQANAAVVVDGVASINLTDMGFEDGTYNVQVRAITKDSTKASTSVLSDAVTYVCQRLGKVQNFALDIANKTLTWDVVDGATKYLVSVNGGEAVEITENVLVIDTNDFVNGATITVQACGSGEKLDSAISTYVINITVPGISLGVWSMTVTEMTSAEWVEYVKNDKQAQKIKTAVLVTDVEEIKKLADSDLVFSAGTLIVLSSDNKVKYVVDRWGHQWKTPTDESNGWFIASGKTVSANTDWLLDYNYGLMKDYIETGDKLLLCSQYQGELASGTLRTVSAYALKGAITGADHRALDITTFTNPSKLVVKGYETSEYALLGQYTMSVEEMTSAEWVAYVKNDKQAQKIKNAVLVTDVEEIKKLSDSDLVFSAGTVIVLSSDNKVKYVVDRWGHQWKTPTDESNGWFIASGKTVSANTDWLLDYNYGLMKDYIETGDKLLLCSQYQGYLASGILRTVSAYALKGAITGADHRALDITTFTNPGKLAVKFVTVS